MVVTLVGAAHDRAGRDSSLAHGRTIGRWPSERPADRRVGAEHQHRLIAARNVDALRTRFNAAARAFAGGRRLLPVQKIDAWVDLEEADDRLLEELDRLRPFGCSHATPVWAARNLRVVGKPQTVGKGHVKFRVAGGALIRDCIAFGRGDAPLPAGPLDIAFQLRRDTFQGRSQLMLNVQDVRAVGS